MKTILWRLPSVMSLQSSLYFFSKCFFKTLISIDMNRVFFIFISTYLLFFFHSTVFFEDCSYSDLTSFYEKAENFSFKFSTWEVKLQYDEHMCDEIHDIQRNLKTLFPDLEELTISLNSDHNSSCPTSDMTDCPENLKNVTLNNLKDKILPKICQPQITYLDCHSCDNLENISSVSDIELQESKI